MGLIESPPNRMQRLSRFPAAPNFKPLNRGKTKPYPRPHANTTFTEQIYTRWCCIELSNPPDLSGPNAVWTTGIQAAMVSSRTKKYCSPGSRQDCIPTWPVLEEFDYSRSA